MNFRPVDDLVLPNSGTSVSTPTNIAPTQLAAGQNDYPDEAAVAFQQLSQLGGYSAIPNCLLDRLRGVLDRNQYDVFLYIIRRTLCFHKLADAISLSQFQSGLISRTGVRLDYGCGIKSSETIHRAIKGLREAGFIEVQATTTYNGGHGANLYTVRYEAVLTALNITSNIASPSPVTIAKIVDVSLDVKEYGDKLPNTAQPQSEPGMCEPPTPISSDAIPYNVPRINKTKSRNQDQTQVRPWGQPLVAGASNNSADIVMSTQNVLDDAQILSNFGFEPRLAMRLARLVHSYDKPSGYVASLITYANQHASTNRHGMVRRLIERGEERSHSVRVQSSPRFSGWLDSSNQEAASSDCATTSVESVVPGVIPPPADTLPMPVTADTTAFDPAYIEQLVITYLAKPAALLKRFEEGQEDEQIVREVLQRLGVYRRLESEFWQARQRHWLNKKRPA